MEYAVLIIERIVIMFIILFIGAVGYKKGLINRSGIKQLSSVELNIVNPALIFMSYQKDYDSTMTKNLMWAFLLSVITFAIAILLSCLLVPKKQKDHIVERFCIVYSNCGFVGIPLINGIFGSEGVLYLTAYITVFNLLIWTHGIMSMKEQRDLSSVLKAFRSLAVIAVILGLPCYLMQLRLPSVPAQALQGLADLNMPLAMLIAGASIGQTNVLSILKKQRNYLICFYKLLLIPIAAFFVMRLFGLPSMVNATLTIAAGCPVATTAIMFAVTLDKDAEKATELFSMSTLFSALTLPLLTMIAMSLS